MLLMKYVCTFLQVADLIASEFFEQGDLEKTQLKIKPMVRDLLVLEVSSFCVRSYSRLFSLN